MSQRECIDLVIRGLEEKMQEEVKKLSEGKSFEEICKIIYRLKNSSTKPAKDPQQTTLTSSNGTSNGINAFGCSGHSEEEEVDAAEAEEGTTLARPEEF